MGSRFHLEKQMTENAIREDEDLTILLKLAAETTPASTPNGIAAAAVAVPAPGPKTVKPKYHSSSTFTNQFSSYTNHHSEAIKP